MEQRPLPTFKHLDLPGGSDSQREHRLETGSRGRAWVNLHWALCTFSSPERLVSFSVRVEGDIEAWLSFLFFPFPTPWLGLSLPGSCNPAASLPGPHPFRNGWPSARTRAAGMQQSCGTSRTRCCRCWRWPRRSGRHSELRPTPSQAEWTVWSGRSTTWRPRTQPYPV